MNTVLIQKLRVRGSKSSPPLIDFEGLLLCSLSYEFSLHPHTLFAVAYVSKWHVYILSGQNFVSSIVLHAQLIPHNLIFLKTFSEQSEL